LTSLGERSYAPATISSTIVTSAFHLEEVIMDRSMRRLGLGPAPASRRCRRWFLALGLGLASALSITPAQATLCGGANYPFPYTDVSGVGAPFCPGIMEAYVTGVTKGTTSTTFSPNDNVIRLQMTTFLQRSLDQGLARASRRAALNQWWTTQTAVALQSIVLVGSPQAWAADETNIWVTTDAGRVVQIEASTGTGLNHWTGATAPSGVLVLGGRVFVAGGDISSGFLYLIDPTQAAGTVTTAASNLGNGPAGIAFDGTHLWTANPFGGSVSIITLAGTTPYPPGNVTTVSTGFSQPLGILFDGASIWVTDIGANKLFKLDASGTIVQSVSVGLEPDNPVFDGENIWVPNVGDSSVTVVQASTGNIVATIAANGTNQLNGPVGASFDGQRILITNFNGSSVSVFKAADLSFIANLSTGPLQPLTACSDGTNFWVTANDLLRF
jgi:hypothetical protein